MCPDNFQKLWGKKPKILLLRLCTHSEKMKGKNAVFKAREHLLPCKLETLQNLKRKKQK